jgi:uncharacterized protein
VSTLDNFRKEAKRWLKAVRTGDDRARVRLHRAYPDAPERSTLRDVQHALAREHGHESWAAMKAAVERRQDQTAPRFGPAERVAAFLEAACPDATVRGPSLRAVDRNAAMRILTRYPEAAHHDLYTAVVCGDLAEVQGILANRPDAASERGGPKAWPPLLYLCNARLPLPAVAEHSVPIARALLDAGADPNAFYLLHGTIDYPYSAFTSVLGRGEEEAPIHPHAEALARLLLERGAEPYDRQLLYNVFADNSSRSLLSDDIIWLLDLIYVHALQRGRQADWSNPDWPMLDPWEEGHGAGFLLEAAIDRNLLRMAEWLLAHSAGPDAIRVVDGRPTRRPYEQARRKGLAEMAALLNRYGATRDSASRADDSPEDLFVAACLRLDRDEVHRLLAEHPDLLQSPKAIFAAAERDRADIVEFLLDLGVSPDIEDAARGRARPLHEAAGSDAGNVISLLIARSADVDARDAQWGATPLGFAVFGHRSRAIDLLGRVSRDVYNLTFIGDVARLREVLSAEPDLAKVVTKYGRTPLMWLPDDEARALEIIDLLLAHGADPAVRNRSGQTAADIALSRGLERAAERLREALSVPGPERGALT